MKKKIVTMASLIVIVLIAVLMPVNKVSADNRIIPGITIDGIDVSGMTAEEAKSAIEAHVRELNVTPVTFVAAQGKTASTTFGDLGVYWSNPEVVDEVFAVGNEGNVINRYKSIKDVEFNGVEFNINVGFDEAKLRSFIEENCSIYDIPVEDATLTRENGEFKIVEGKAGEVVDIDASIADIQANIYTYFKEGQTTIKLVVVESSPEGSREELAQIKDIIGTFTTSYSSSGSNRSANVANGCSLINGTILYPGEEFSTYNTIKPFTTDNGYYLAGSYLNGQVVESLGGGICQVSSTLYNAVIRAELEVVERHNHSMIVTYVQKSGDAAIAESSGKDFRFKNNTEYPIYIEGYTQDKQITFNIYGVETRPSNRTLEFESEVISETVPDTDNIVADPSQPIGYISTTSAHIGYRANLWKIVYVDGEEVSREQLNSSNYAASPRTAIVGVSTSNPDYYNFMMSSIASGSIDNCKAAAAQIKSLEAAAQQPAPAPEVPQ